MASAHLIVHLDSEEDSRCVADALIAAGGTVARSPSSFDLDVAGSSLEAILAAVQQCITENEISLARVTVDGRTYLMEAPPATSSA